MSITSVTFSEAMEGSKSDNSNLSKDQQYEKIIQELVRELMRAKDGEPVWIAPHAFGEPDSLACWTDDVGNIKLTASMKSAFEAVS